MMKSSAHTRKRREEILEAARHCFLFAGFRATKMSDIARQFGMSVGHVYNYFPSKQAIVEALFEKGIEEFYESSRELLATSELGDNNFETVRNLVKRNLSYCQDVAEIRLMLELLLESDKAPKLKKLIQDTDAKVRAHLHELHRLNPEDPREVAKIEIMMTIFEGIGLRVIRNPEIDMENIYDAITRRLLTSRIDLERRIEVLEAENRALKVQLAKA